MENTLEKEETHGKVEWTADFERKSLYECRLARRHSLKGLFTVFAFKRIYRDFCGFGNTSYTLYTGSFYMRPLH